MTAPRSVTAPGPEHRGAGTAAWIGVLAVVSLVDAVWLVVGAVVLVAGRGHSFPPRPRAARGSWSRAVADAATLSEPVGQAVADYALSLGAIVLAVALLRRAPRWWVARWLSVALVASSGAFNLQANAAASVIREATGVAAGPLGQLALHGVFGPALFAAVLLYPSGAAQLSELTRWILGPFGAAVALLVGLSTAQVPDTVSAAVLFGLAVPVGGLVLLGRRQRRGLSPDRALQVRLLRSVLMGTLAAAAVLGLLTLVLMARGRTGLDLIDPTAHPASTSTGRSRPGPVPIAPLFWFARVASLALAVAVLMAADRVRLPSAERRFGRGLALGLLVVATGTTIALGDALLPTSWGLASLIVLVVVVGALHPLFVTWIERWVDHLLYGRRPTPYSALARLARLSERDGADGPDFGAVAESVGKGLGAQWCELSVVRPGLSERTYRWAVDTVDAAWNEDPAWGEDPAWIEDRAPIDGAALSVPIRRDGERIGELTVDRVVGAGLDTGRSHLLEDVATALTPVLESGRLGIDLERQLRAALAHAEDIAVSRRTIVAEMDHERRRIERDLHDGAQHHLVSLRLILGLVSHHAGQGRLKQARDRLAQARERIATASSVLTETATGVSSLVLAEHGIVSALRADFAGSEPPVELTSTVPAGQRYDEALESAVYFCCLEAVNNARKHAPGARVDVELSEPADSNGGATLRFRVRDDGPGFDVAAVGSGGRGVHNTTARIARVGGALTFDSAPGRGTVVQGSVPVTASLDEPSAPGTTRPDASRSGVSATSSAPDVSPAPASTPAVLDR